MKATIRGIQCIDMKKRGTHRKMGEKKTRSPSVLKNKEKGQKKEEILEKGSF